MTNDDGLGAAMALDGAGKPGREAKEKVEALEKRVAELERVVKYLAQFSGNPEINQYGKPI